MDAEAPGDLRGVLGQLAAACDAQESHITVSDVQKALGRRSFGPVLLVPGLIGISPIGAIPGVPGIMAVIEILIATQILIGFKSFWLPPGLARRSIAASRLKRAIDMLMPYAGIVDRFLYPRLTFLATGPAAYGIAFMCLLVALVMPIIELVPLAGIVPNAAIVAFGLGLTAHDGVWTALACLFTIGSFYLLFMVW
jgi:hypothetical protein